MAQYKVLKSVAHNLGHSYLSLMNYREGDYVVNHLYRAALAAAEPAVRVDVKRGSISPKGVRTPLLDQSVADQRSWFPRLVQSQGAAFDTVADAWIDVRFAFGESFESPHLPGVQFPKYSCSVTIVDDRGKQYEVAVPPWYEYCVPKRGSLTSA